MDILDLIHDATKEANSFTNHPAKELSLEERLLYLNGLSLVMNSDAEIDEDEKEYIRILIKSFELDESCLNDMVAFAQSPDKDTIQAFFRTFRRKPLAQLFLFDAYMMGMRDGSFHDREIAVIDKIAEQLEILKGTKRDVFDLFCHIKNKDWQESSLFFSSHLLNPEHFKHLLDYFEVDFKDLINTTKSLQQSRLMERVLNNEIPKWISLEYGQTHSLTETEITSDFVDLSFTYGMVVPFLQSMLDRGEVRVFENNVYFQNQDSSEELLLNLKDRDEIGYDSLARAFSIDSGLENEKCKSVTKSLIAHYFNFLQLGINIDSIARTSKHPSYDKRFFPKAKNGSYLTDEIVMSNGNFYQNIWGASDIWELYSKKDAKVEMELVDILTSGRIRFVR